MQVERSACGATSFDDLAAILRVELFGRLDEGPPQSSAYLAAIDCSGDLVAISVRVPGGSIRSRRTSLAGAPVNVRSRIVALAVAELVRDLDREPAASPPAEPPPPPPIAREPSAPPPQGHAAPVALEAFAQTSTFKLNGLWLAGGGMRFDYAYRRFCAGLDVALLTATETFAPGSAQIVLAYGSPYVAWRERLGRAQTRLGAGYALGVARLSGHPSQPRAFAGTTSGPWSAPYLFAALAVEIAGGVGLEARGQVGGVTSSVVGDVAGGGGVALDGTWVSVELGLTIAL